MNRVLDGHLIGRVLGRGGDGPKSCHIRHLESGALLDGHLMTMGSGDPTGLGWARQVVEYQAFGSLRIACWLIDGRMTFGGRGKRP
jgi:hypothetical protein